MVKATYILIMHYKIISITIIISINNDTALFVVSNLLTNKPGF